MLCRHVTSVSDSPGSDIQLFFANEQFNEILSHQLAKSPNLGWPRSSLVSLRQVWRCSSIAINVADHYLNWLRTVLVFDCRSSRRLKDINWPTCILGASAKTNDLTLGVTTTRLKWGSPTGREQKKLDLRQIMQQQYPTAQRPSDNQLKPPATEKSPARHSTLAFHRFRRGYLLCSR